MKKRSFVVGVRGDFEFPGFELEREPMRYTVAYQKATGRRYVVEITDTLFILRPLVMGVPVGGLCAEVGLDLDDERAITFPRVEVMK
ncbi:MAG: hypothetical protein WCF18_21665 [Chthoniobacteraceae bacterium]